MSIATPLKMFLEERTMNNFIVVYYSRTGNNKYIAEKIAQQLGCDIEELIPRNKAYFSVLLSSLTKMSFGNRKMASDLEKYEKVIVCCPIWMGHVIAPMRSFIKQNRGKIKRLTYVTCCGSDEESKNGKFGYEVVFGKIKKMIGDAFENGFAIPIGLTVEKERRKATNSMDLRLTDATFRGEIEDRFDDITREIRE